MRLRLKGLREEHNLTQQALAQKLHVAQTTYSDYELGKINIPLAIVAQLALMYETSVDYLLGLTDTATPYPRKEQKRIKQRLPGQNG